MNKIYYITKQAAWDAARKAHRVARKGTIDAEELTGLNGFANIDLKTLKGRKVKCYINSEGDVFAYTERVWRPIEVTLKSGRRYTCHYCFDEVTEQPYYEIFEDVDDDSTYEDDCELADLLGDYERKGLTKEEVLRNRAANEAQE